jgi:dihydrolipoamide dehydrogenase
VTNLHAVPERVAIVGGGVVGCEAATWLIGLGARSVTLVVRGDRLLSRAEPFAGEAVAEGLRAAGVDVRLGTEVERVERGPVIETAVGRPRGAEAVLAVGGEPLAVDEVVVATGRAPSTGDLGLESVGLDPEAPLEVDEHLAVGGSDWLYAVGDVNGLSLLTHMGKYQARICGDAIAARAAARRPPHRDYADGRAVTQVTFTDPQVASVGPTEAQARERLGERVDAIELDISVSGAKLLRDGYSGRAKLVLDRADGTLLGATFVGPDVGELLHAATIAVVGRVTLDRLWHAVPAFPTVSEVWLRLLEALRTR